MAHEHIHVDHYCYIKISIPRRRRTEGSSSYIIVIKNLQSVDRGRPSLFGISIVAAVCYRVPRDATHTIIIYGSCARR